MFIANLAQSLSSSARYPFWIRESQDTLALPRGYSTDDEQMREPMIYSERVCLRER